MADAPLHEAPTEHALEEFYDALLDDDAEALYDRAPCGYLSTTPEGTITKVNQTFLTLTGFERSALVGRRTFSELLAPGGRIYHETHYAPMLLMQGSAREIALDIVRADGQRLPVLVNAVLERDADGAPVVARVAVFDATERREYERELLRAKDRAEVSEAQARLLARTLQETLIPPAIPEIAHLDVAAAYRPAGVGDEIGGDFYDVFEIGAGDWAVTIGDVRGKGVEAAVVTALARYTLRGATVRHQHPSAVLEVLNQVLLHHDTDRFLTSLLVRLRRIDGSWQAAWSSGGHPLPLVMRAGAAPEAVGTPGTLLGVIGDTSFPVTEVELHPGDAVVLYTDGVTEARRGTEFYDDARLLAAVAANAGAAAAPLADALLRDVLEFQGDAPRDDIAIVVIVVPAD